MSLPLVDARIKITPATDAVLESQHKSTGRDKSELMRDVLHKWAEGEIKAMIFVRAELKDKGILRDYEGTNSPASPGVSYSRRKSVQPRSRG